MQHFFVQPASCKNLGMSSPPIELQNFAKRYTTAWCSQNAASVAAFYSPDGSLCINAGTPSVGRNAIANSVQEFMTAFPDLQVCMDELIVQSDGAVYHWTLTGTNSGPGGTGRLVRISGFETWRLSPEGLIAQSQGSFDDADYQRQLLADVASHPAKLTLAAVLRQEPVSGGAKTWKRKTRWHV